MRFREVVSSGAVYLQGAFDGANRKDYFR